MKLQIKTLNQKSLLIDIEETKSVYDLKRELSLYPDVGVKAELQKLIYAGKILVNDELLSTYNIDTKKFLVVMVLKQPQEEDTKPATSTSTAAAAATSAATPPAIKQETKTSSAPVKVEDEFKTPQPPAAAAAAAATAATTPTTPTATPATKSKNEQLVENIVNMGYPESEVRRALAASFFNPERAIEYLIEGIPASPSTPEGGSGFEAEELSPFEAFRSDPLFRNLRRAIQQHPELIDDAIARVGEANPAILGLINENQQEFLSMLVDASDDEEGDDDDENMS